MEINDIPIEGIYEDVEASGVFGKSKRQKKFFKYLLEKNAIGDTIVAYSVAVDVFDRPIDFDASVDSIVRTETHRLRNRLEIYNGNPNKYWIDFPKGGLELSVRTRKSAESIPAKLRGKFTGFLLFVGLSILIATMVFNFVKDKGLSFDQTNCSLNRPNIFVSTGSKGEDSSQSELSKFVTETTNAVITQHQTFNLLEVAGECEATPLYELNIEVYSHAHEEVVAFQAIRIADDTELFRTVGSINSIESDSDSLFAFTVRTISDLVKPDGLLSQDTLSLEWARKIDKQNMTCWVGTYTAGILDKTEDFNSAIDCLEFVTQQENPYPENLALLAYMYVLQDIGAFPPSQNRTRTIESLIAEGHSIDSKRYELLVAELYAETKKEGRDNQKMRDISARLGSEFPLTQPAQLQRLLTMSYTLGQWEEAKEVSRFLKSITSQRDNSILLYDVGYDLLFSDRDIALVSVLKQYSKNNVHSNLNLLTASNFAGDRKNAQLAVEALAELGLNNVEDYIAHIRSRRFEPKITQRLIEGVSIVLE